MTVTPPDDGVPATPELVGAVPAGPDEPSRPSLLRNLTHLFSSQAVTWALATAVTVVLPRYLGPETYGRLRLPWAIWNITQMLVVLGTSMYLMLEMARDRERGMKLVGPIIALRVITFVCATVVLTGGAIASSADLETIMIIELIGAGVLLASIADVMTAALMGLEQMSFTAVATVVTKVVYTGAVIAVVVLGGGIQWVAATSGIGAFAGLLVIWRSFRRFGRVSFASPFRSIPSVVGASWVFFLSAAVLTVYQQVDTIVIAAIVDNAALGFYTTADSLFSTLLFVPTILLVAMFPRFGRLHVEDPLQLDRLVRQTFSSMLLISVPMGLGTVVIADELSLLMFGEEYRDTGPVLAVFGVVMILVFGTILLGGVATATERQKFWNILMAVAVLASIPLDLVFVAWTESRFDNGAMGGALAYVVTESLMMAVGIWKIAPTIAGRASLVRLGKISVAGLVMFAAIWPLRHLFPLVPAVVGAAVYIPTLLLLRTPTDDERAIAWRGLARFGLGPWRHEPAAVGPAPHASPTTAAAPDEDADEASP